MANKGMRAAKLMDFSEVVVQKKNMLGPEVILREGTYVAETTVLAVSLIEQCCREAKVGTIRPDYLNVATIEGEPEDIALAPTLQESSASLPVKWVEDGSVARIDMTKLLMKRRFPIPPGTTAHIPVGKDHFENLGAALVLKFSQVRFEAVQERQGGKKAEAAPEKAAAADQPAVSTAGAQGATPGGEAGAPVQAQAPASEEE